MMKKGCKFSLRGSRFKLRPLRYRISETVNWLSVNQATTFRIISITGELFKAKWRLASQFAFLNAYGLLELHVLNNRFIPSKA